MHALGVIHRDLKCDNMLYANGSVKIFDFGLATLGKGVWSQGSPLSMAPEIIFNSNSDDKVDIWALGQVLMEMITLRYQGAFATASDVNDPNGYYKRMITAMRNGTRQQALFQNAHGKNLKTIITDRFGQPNNDLEVIIKEMMTFDSQRRATALEVFNSPWVKQFSLDIEWQPKRHQYRWILNESASDRVAFADALDRVAFADALDAALCEAYPGANYFDQPFQDFATKLVQKIHRPKGSFCMSKKTQLIEFGGALLRTHANADAPSNAVKLFITESNRSQILKQAGLNTHSFLRNYETSVATKMQEA